MVHAKNYVTTSTFVKVMQRKLWLLFFHTRCTYMNILCNGAIYLGIFYNNIDPCPLLLNRSSPGLEEGGCGQSIP